MSVEVNICWWDNWGNEKTIHGVELATYPREKDVLDLELILIKLQSASAFGDERPHDLDRLVVSQVKHVVLGDGPIVEVWVNAPGSLACPSCGAQVDCEREHVDESDLDELRSLVRKARAAGFNVEESLDGVELEFGPKSGAWTQIDPNDEKTWPHDWVDYLFWWQHRLRVGSRCGTRNFIIYGYSNQFTVEEMVKFSSIWWMPLPKAPNKDRR